MFSLPDFYVWLLIVFKSMQDLKLAAWQYFVCCTRSMIRVAYKDFFFLVADDCWCWQFQKAFSFFSSSHIFGCYLEVLGSGRIASNNIWIPFSFSFQSTLAVSWRSLHIMIIPVFREVTLVLRVFKSISICSQTVTSNQYDIKHYCNRFYFGGRRAEEQLHIFCCRLHLFVGLLELHAWLSSSAYFLGNISKKPIHAKKPP